VACHRRGSAPPLIERLFREGFRFDLDRAVGHLERLRPERAPLATGSDPAREAVSFASAVRYDFPASDIEEIRPPATPDGPARVTVNVLGLAGAFGPLPLPDTERVTARLKRRDRAFADLLDLFNHRLIAVLLRGRRASRPALDGRPPWRTPMAGHLRALIGLLTGGLEGRLAVPDRALLRHAGLLALRPRSAHGLAAVLGDHLGLPVAVRPLVGRWRRLEASQTTVLGEGGRNRALGQEVVLGGRVWDQAAALALRIGPMDRRRFLALLPGGRLHRELRALAGFYTDRRFDLDLRLVLGRDEVQRTPIGRDGPRLGWTSWIGRRPPAADDDQVRIHLPALETP
jgi:type VI secretion system protein ImpH